MSDATQLLDDMARHLQEHRKRTVAQDRALARIEALLSAAAQEIANLRDGGSDGAEDGDVQPSPSTKQPKRKKGAKKGTRRANLTDEERHEIMTRLAQGESGSVLAKEFGCARSTISNHLSRKAAPKKRKSPVKTTPEQRKEILNRLKRGESASDLAKEFGFASSSGILDMRARAEGRRK